MVILIGCILTGISYWNLVAFAGREAVSLNSNVASIEDTGATLYWSNSDDRWMLEALDVTWEASQEFYQDVGGFNAYDDRGLGDRDEDDRLFPGLQVYFGDKPSIWNQAHASFNGAVHVSMECYDTSFPTETPTQQPTEQPTQQPTLAPTELCTALTLTVADKDTTAITKYNGIYMKQATLVNGRDWWKQRFVDDDHTGHLKDSSNEGHLHIVSPPTRGS